MKQLDLRVGNLDCENDAAKLQRELGKISGVEVIQIFPSAAKVRIALDEDKISQANLSDSLEDMGFPVVRDREEMGPPPFLKNPKVLASLASGILLGLGWGLSSVGAPHAVSVGSYALSVLIGGFFFAKEALEELIHERKVGIELLMSVAAIASFAMGEMAEASMLVFLYSISEALEGYTEAKTRSAVRALMDLTPKLALVKRGDLETEIPVEDLSVGDIFIVKPGQAIPTDGLVIVGHSSVNQAPVTGESVPVEKSGGQIVFAGSINGEGSLEVRATKAFAENTISRIIQMVEEAQERKGKSQRFIEQFGNWYSPIVLCLGVLIAVVPAFFLNGESINWLTRAVVFIVAAAPCALVISIPITLVAALGTGARNGVLIKGGAFLEELAKVSVVALDKTGTITLGQPEVIEIALVGKENGIPSEEEFLAVAAGIEQRSQHPLAQAILRFAEAKKIRAAKVESFQSLTGAGAHASYQNETVYIAKPEFFQKDLKHSLSGLSEQITRLQGSGNTVVVLGTEKAAWGALAIRDRVRPNVTRAIQALYALGIKKIVMLTGDNELAAQAIGREAGIDEICANLKPEDKAVLVRKLSERYGHVAMVGDGVNDAPALAEASVGIAMGAAGTDVALETADVALMADDLEKLVYALNLSRRNQRTVQQNLALSVLVIGILVVGAISGKFSLPVAVVGHELSELIVIMSGLRMLRS